MTDLSIYEGHTPGPWEVVWGSPDGGWYIESQFNGTIVCDVPPSADAGDNGSPDARAIAGLPDILAYARELEARNAELVRGLESVVMDYAMYGINVDQYNDAILAALSRAKGDGK
ncbi:MAG: hypothetical protein P1U84_05040 [Parvibaculaceae bacterium]|nr:hypothetical protein [Parvibaculaceae bacterium]